MDSVKTIIQSLLVSMGNLAQPQKKFLLTLFSTLVMSCGRATFTNLSRYSQLNERTYRRQYQRSFNFIKFNQQLIEQAIKPESEVILAVDCSFIPKSGNKTYGIDYFYNGSASKTEKGLEISAMAVVDVKNKIGYNLSVQQTPANTSSSKKPRQSETTRINHYLTQLEATVPYLPASLRYVVSDDFVNGLADCQARDLTKLDFHFNSSLSALNLAKWDAVQQHHSDTNFVFSMASYKRRAFNYHLLERFIDKLGLEPTFIKSHPNYSSLYDYGSIVA